MSQQTIGEHAIVIGASVAGLLAARALSEAYERVTIVERDHLPPVGEGRKAVPQGRHAHVMLASGLGAIEELLPGVTKDMYAAGAQPCESLREVRLVISGHELWRDALGADVLLASRPLIEGQVRRRVHQEPIGARGEQEGDLVGQCPVPVNVWVLDPAEQEMRY